jgi:choline kinase
VIEQFGPAGSGDGHRGIGKRLPLRRHRPPREVTALILSAGRGSRLRPLTDEIPKAMVSVAGRPILSWQLDALHAAGVRTVTIVVGFGAGIIEQFVATAAPVGMRVRTVLNPFHDVADNLISCWSAREYMDGDFLLVNGDTLFEPALIERLLRSRQAPVTVAVRRKPAYDEDDMKVQCFDAVLRHIGKKLPAESACAESIGVMYFRGSGPGLFRDAIEQAVSDPAAKRWWYPSAVDRIAAMTGTVRVAYVDGLATAEVDVPEDLADAERVAHYFRSSGADACAASAE